LLSVFAVVVLVLLVVALGGRFIGYLQEAALGKYPAGSLLEIIWLRLPEFLQQLLPFAYYVALLLAVGRLHAEHEMPVLQGGGVGPARMIVWLLPMTLLVAVLVGFLTLAVTPRNTADLEQFFAEQRQRQEFDGMAPGVFRTLQGGKRVTYTESLSENRQQLGNVFIAEYDARRPVTVWAESGSQYVDPATGSQFLLLENGTRYEGAIGARDYRVVSFATLAQRLAVSPRGARRVDTESMLTQALLADSAAASAAELQWRLGLPLLVLIGAGLGLGMARVKPRQGRFARVAPGITVFVGYYLLLVLMKDLTAEGDWPSQLGAWPVHVGFALLALYLLRRVSLPAGA
jgi:lipopolysaccharide export system permease protein